MEPKGKQSASKNMVNELPFFTSDIKQEVKLRMTSEGAGSWKPKTVMEVFNDTVARVGDKPALYQKRPEEVCQESSLPIQMYSSSLTFHPSNRAKRSKTLIGRSGLGLSIVPKSTVLPSRSCLLDSNALTS